MRLFIAAGFDETTKAALSEAAKRLEEHAISGNFTRRENMHLTLAFIGETQKLSLIKETMNGITASPFTLRMRGLGSFERAGGDILWLGVETCAALIRLQAELAHALREKGFPIERRRFRPHLTLGREAVLNEAFSRKEWERTVGMLCQRVTQIDLMESKRTGGKLVYTCLYSTLLKG